MVSYRLIRSSLEAGVDIIVPGDFVSSNNTEPKLLELLREQGWSTSYVLCFLFDGMHQNLFSRRCLLSRKCRFLTKAAWASMLPIGLVRQPWSLKVTLVPRYIPLEKSHYKYRC